MIHVWKLEADREGVHRCLRSLLSLTTGIAADDIRFTRGAYGKPLHPSINFNVSHAGGKALIALCADRRVGVDIEKHRNDIRIDLLTRELLSMRRPLSRDDFFACWTRREAAVKARGGSILGPIETHPSDAEWRTIDLPCDEGYSAALCYEGQEAVVLLREYTL